MPSWYMTRMPARWPTPHSTNGQPQPWVVRRPSAIISSISSSRLRAVLGICSPAIRSYFMEQSGSRQASAIDHRHALGGVARAGGGSDRRDGIDRGEVGGAERELGGGDVLVEPAQL